MASTDLAESSFSGVTVQVQCYGLIYMCSTDDVSDTARNGFLYCPTINKQMEGHQKGLFHGMPNELQITLVMVAMEDAPETNNKITMI